MLLRLRFRIIQTVDSARSRRSRPEPLVDSWSIRSRPELSEPSAPSGAVRSLRSRWSRCSRRSRRSRRRRWIYAYGYPRWKEATHFLGDWISLTMNEDERNNSKEYFHRKTGIANITMCINCTHIKIKKKPHHRPLLYINRKRFYSLNVMLVLTSDVESCVK